VFVYDRGGTGKGLRIDFDANPGPLQRRRISPITSNVPARLVDAMEPILIGRLAE
jgi:hypothetical protein